MKTMLKSNHFTPLSPPKTKRAPAQPEPRRIIPCNYLSESETTPGRAFPSRNSSEAPPPVEMWLILSARPDLFTAETLSPPPMIETPPFAFTSATAAQTPKVPFENAGISKQPIGPFQTTVLAPLIASA